ncbi:60S acidic ribosomal protein [Mycena indigotica]|uniref:60S acidic ribosomal protein n=1 Tax=Mycena indigotica TaxID=2126181 RepID=A0A8H6S5X2_9AGAR|nr:60S acidic ribosomal protein [Mycena indigotica]KAF7291880.1 60S acidic ribosomal protein [Mycena indigotica]
MASPELAATYAALILADADTEITTDNILTLTAGANVELEPIWATLLAKALEGKNVKDLLSTVGTASGTGPVAAASAPVQTESKQVEEEKPASDAGEDSDDDLFGGGLFD